MMLDSDLRGFWFEMQRLGKPATKFKDNPGIYLVYMVLCIILIIYMIQLYKLVTYLMVKLYQHGKEMFMKTFISIFSFIFYPLIAIWTWLQWGAKVLWKMMRKLSQASSTRSFRKYITSRNGTRAELIPLMNKEEEKIHVNNLMMRLDKVLTEIVDFNDYYKTNILVKSYKSQYGGGPNDENGDNTKVTKAELKRLEAIKKQELKLETDLKYIEDQMQLNKDQSKEGELIKAKENILGKLIILKGGNEQKLEADLQNIEDHIKLNQDQTKDGELQLARDKI